MEFRTRNLKKNCNNERILISKVKIAMFLMCADIGGISEYFHCYSHRDCWTNSDCAYRRANLFFSAAYIVEIQLRVSSNCVLVLRHFILYISYQRLRGVSMRRMNTNLELVSKPSETKVQSC